nr:Heat shock protein DnaJ and Thioredoxin domain containing protein [Haemonchus contortus]
MRSALLVLLIALLLELVITDEDYYKILGVAKDADDRTIRKAFKKLAMHKHPDKNKDNPNAHAEFVKINKAYEVLKDEDLRKRYDQYGEKGLEDGFQGGNNYQSWQFYNENFGIYDDDVEIVTLNRNDFQRLVTQSTEIWFINFYSTYCSHCHQLAPTWRKFARAMEGVVRIGAVNCAEDVVLCQSQNVNAYPSLVLYPSGEFYNGVRDSELLQEFVMQRVTSEVLHLTSDNIEALTTSWQPYDSRPWIIDFCDRSDSCLSSINRRKLATMLDGLVNVGSIDCTSRGGKDLCDVLKVTSGVRYYPTQNVDVEHEKVMNSLDPKELLEEVLSFLDGLEEIEEKDLHGLLGDDSVEWPTAVWFVNNKETLEERKDYKRLPQLLPDVRIFYADCSQFMEVCRDLLDITKLPQFVVFKTTGGHEIDYVNKPSYHDVTAFIKESLASPLHVLSVEEYDSAVRSGELWMIDYFTPWCPPCLRLISEYRQLHSVIDQSDPVLSKIKLGLMDCVKYKGVCEKAGVQSYPTSALHTADGRVYKFVGYHSVQSVLEDINNALNPAVDELTPADFERLVQNRGGEVTWVVDFFAPCDYPQNMWRNSDTIERWVFGMLPSLVTSLGNDFWHGVLDSDEPWLVDFFAPWCGPCIQFAPVFEQVAKELEGKVKLGKVDCDVWPGVCRGAQIQAYPSIRFYKGQHDGRQQGVWGLQLQTRNKDEIVRLISEQVEMLSGHDEL